MARTIPSVTLFLTMFVAIECRQGWKTYGNGYFVYESKTDFPKTNELRIDGIFSVMTNTTAKSTLLSVYDADDKFAFQLMINQDIFYTAYNADGVVEEKAWNAHGISDGYGYAFTVTVTKNQSASGLLHTLKTDILHLSRGGFTVIIPKVTFNFTRVTIKIGGNSLPDPVASQFFKGCLSNFTFQGTGIISTYFRQYPKNTNPVRGKETFIKSGHGFSNVSEPCDDVMTTTGPQTTAPSTTEHQSSSTQSSTSQSNATTSSGKYATATTPSSSSNNKNHIAIGTLFFSIWLSFMAKK